ncbi:MAG: cytochrome b/b6 domain-containing protein [Gemmatimonadota bacterium]|jgi:cytochrome b subunit of formate dehydrogenase
MELLRTAPNPWGQEVLVGIGWDVVWIAVWASVAFVVLHTVFMLVRRSRDEAPPPSPAPAGLPERVQRHSGASRAFHWLMSVAMFGLLVTAFVPVLGLRFPWVELHWIAGLLLVAAIVYHVIHALGWQDFWSMWMKPSEMGEGLKELKHALGAGSGAPPKSGKYPFDHKLYHNVIVVVTVAAMATGVLMMVRIDTPLWTRNPYLLSDHVWGVVYVLHGLAGVALIGLVTAHVYFALRPEKRWITWSMVRGWITRERYLAYFDPARWRVGEEEPSEPLMGGAVADAAAHARRDDA